MIEIWWTLHLRPALLAALVPHKAVRNLVGAGDIESLLRALEVPDNRFGAHPTKERDTLLRDTLKAAFQDCQRRLGADSGVWRWGGYSLCRL